MSRRARFYYVLPVLIEQFSIVAVTIVVCFRYVFLIACFCLWGICFGLKPFRCTANFHFLKLLSFVFNQNNLSAFYWNFELTSFESQFILIRSHSTDLTHHAKFMQIAGRLIVITSYCETYGVFAFLRNDLV